MSDSLRERLQASLGAAYILERELGGGGMSRVFVAREVALNRDVVVKVLAPELAEGLSAERFSREIQLVAALQEPHIVPVLAAGTTSDGLPWYTMPFVRGESLRARIGRGLVPTGEAVSILRDIAHALAYAHEHGVVHRDIKPENVLLSSGTAMVTDFGIAKALQASRTQAPGGTLTQIGTSLGTPAYMAPEQAVGDVVDHRADIYAWGVVGYELLAGMHPFAGKTTAQQLIAAHIAETPPPLGARRTGVPDTLDTLVMRCLEKDPARRPASAAELLTSLEAVRTGDQTVSHRAGGRGRRVAVTAGLLIVTGAGAVVAWLGSERSSDSTDSATIAVLPFENHGPADRAFFADGLTDAVTGKLVGVSGLMVIERGSAATYKGTTKTNSQIGTELGVAYLLKGVVRWAQDAAGQWRAQVTPTLVRTRDDVAQWAGDPVIVTPTDPFTAQAEIASKVVSAIGITIGARERASMAKAPTKNAEAYELYVRARTLHHDPDRRVPGSPDLQEAARLLGRATELDPSFADAFAALARVEYDLTVTDPTAARRYEAALRAALALDPEHAEAHFARAEYLWFREPRFAESAAAFARASALQPGNAEFLSQHAAVQIVTGHQTSEGFTNLERTIVLDPRDPTANSRAAYFCWHFRRFDASERHAQRMLAIARDNWTGHAFLVQIALARGDTAAARGVLASAQRATGQDNSSALVFWMLPPSLAGSGSVSTGRRPVPALAPGSDSLFHYAALGAWARETGQEDRAKLWFDSAVAVARAPQYALTNRRIHMTALAAFQAIALAGTGRVAEARHAIAVADSIERLVALPNEPNIAAAQDYLGYALLVLGDREAALARLERLLALPSGRTPAMLRTMWPYASLHGDPRFRRLAEMGV